jgi:long-chain acyl-CoA synthetase
MCEFMQHDSNQAFKKFHLTFSRSHYILSVQGPHFYQIKGSDMILKRIQEAAAQYPDKVAVQMKTGDQYRQYPYRDLIRNVASVSRAFSGQGIGKGDRVALLSENRPEWVFTYLSVVALGAVIVPLDAQLTDREVALLLASSGAKAVCVSDSCRSKLPGNRELMVISFDPGDGIQFHAMLTAHPDAALPASSSADDLAAILYTSGTTGDPKGVMLSQGNLASNCASAIRLKIVLPEDNLLCMLPLHHTYPAMACMLLTLSLGATVTMLNSLKGPDMLSCMQETGVSVLVGVPQLLTALRRAIFEKIDSSPVFVRTLAKLLLALSRFCRNTAGIMIGKALFGKVHARFGPRFRLMASGGARLDPDVFSDLSDLGIMVIEAYGLTETSPAATFNPIGKQKAGSIGVPIPDVEVRIVNPDEFGQGEIAIRGPNVMLGYYNMPRETAEVLRDGWFYTGDIGYRDRDGYLFITGRSKEMIVLGTGKKIFPEELEKFYKQIPAIKEICLMLGDRGLEAAVVPDFDYLRKMNLSNSRETIAFEIEDLAKDLPPYKRITGLKIFKDPLPATRLGKLKRSKVHELYLTSGERAEKPVASTDAGLLDSPMAKKLITCLEQFSVKKNIVPDDNLELDLGLDSLSRVELVVSIEQSFGISLPESFGSEIFTVKDVVLRLQEELASGPVQTVGRARMSWAAILAQEPAEETRLTVTLEPQSFYQAVLFVVKMLLTLIMKLYGRLSVRGLENLPAKGPYIIAPNHLSLADMPAVTAAVPWSTASTIFSLGAREYFHGPFMSKLSRIFHVIPVDMDVKLHSALQLSAYVLRRGKVLCVFPEGTRSRDGELKDFKKGVGIIAKELNIPIVPVAIKGTYEMMPSGKLFPRPGRAKITFGRPVVPGDKDYDAIVKELHEEVEKMLEENK